MIIELSWHMALTMMMFLVYMILMIVLFIGLAILLAKLYEKLALSRSFIPFMMYAMIKRHGYDKVKEELVFVHKGKKYKLKIEELK